MNNHDSQPIQLTFTQRLSQVIKRFGQDLSGVVLLAAGVIILLGVFGITSGKLVDSGVELLRKGFGWGIYLLSCFIIYIGLMIILRHFERFPKINYGKIFLM